MPAPQAGKIGDPGIQPVGVSQGAPDMLYDHFTGRIEPNALAGALEYLEAELLFIALQAALHGRGRLKHLLGRGTDGACSLDGVDHAEGDKVFHRP